MDKKGMLYKSLNILDDKRLYFVFLNGLMCRIIL